MPVTPIGPAGIPSLGLGTFQTAPGETADIVAAALSEGYRHIDTAQVYGNEEGVGRGLKMADVPRDQVFVTTKIFPDHFDAEGFRAAALLSLDRLGTDYIDLMLLHWPSHDVPLAETLPVLDALIDEGKIRAGGVSNFTIAQLNETAAHLKAPIAANQIEIHPFFQQPRLRSFMEEKGIPFEAYSPIARGNVMGNDTLAEIGAAHDASEAQIAIAWVMHQENGIALPKTATKARLAQNLAAAEITLSAEELQRIDALHRPDGRIIDPDFAPDWDD